MKASRRSVQRSRQIVTLRLPDGCHISSASVRRMMQTFLRHPGKLPADPGAGSKRVSLSLSRQELGWLVSILKDSASASLRRVIAWGIGFPPVQAALGLRAVKGAGLETILAGYKARIAGLQGQSRGEGAGALAGSQAQRTGQARTIALSSTQPRSKQPRYQAPDPALWSAPLR